VSPLFLQIILTNSASSAEDVPVRSNQVYQHLHCVSYKLPMRLASTGGKYQIEALVIVLEGNYQCRKDIVYLLVKVCNDHYF
jgi:hypothetical protein